MLIVFLLVVVVLLALIIFVVIAVLLLLLLSSSSSFFFLYVHRLARTLDVLVTHTLQGSVSQPDTDRADPCTLDPRRSVDRSHCAGQLLKTLHAPVGC